MAFVVLDILRRHQNILEFLSFLDIQMGEMAKKDMFILNSQYHGSWWPGVARSQGVNNQIIGKYTQDIWGSVSEGLRILYEWYSAPEA